MGAAVWGAGAAVRCLLALRGGEEGVVCSGSSRDRSRRTGALRFRDGAGPAAGIEDEGPELGESAASLAAERVTLEDMSTWLSGRWRVTVWDRRGQGRRGRDSVGKR